MNEDETDPFARLGWKVEIVRLADLHTPFNPSPECGVSGAKRFRDDYEITPFSQSTQAWKSRLEEEDRQRYVERIKMQLEKVQKRSEATVECEMFDAVDLSSDILWTSTETDDDEESNDVEQGTKPIAEVTEVLSFRERMKRLSPHWLPLKVRMKDQTMSYIDLLRPDPLPIRLEQDPMPRVSRRLTLQKMKSENERATENEHDRILKNPQKLELSHNL